MKLISGSLCPANRTATPADGTTDIRCGIMTHPEHVVDVRFDRTTDPGLFARVRNLRRGTRVTVGYTCEHGENVGHALTLDVAPRGTGSER